VGFEATIPAFKRVKTFHALDWKTRSEEASWEAYTYLSGKDKGVPVLNGMKIWGNGWWGQIRGYY
jgi:hypothetical protein